VKYLKYLLIFLGLVVVAVAGFGGYKFLENEKVEVEKAKQEKEAEDNTVLAKSQRALAANRWTSGALKVSYNDQNKTLFIVDDSDPNSGLDQTSDQSTPRDIVEQSYNLFVRAGQAVFTVEGVETVEYSRNVPINVGSGVVTPTQVIRIVADKKEFLSVDWDSLRGTPIHNVLSEAAKVQMHPGFQRNVGNTNTIVLYQN
jgi:hypothetical protein